MRSSRYSVGLPLSAPVDNGNRDDILWTWRRSCRASGIFQSAWIEPLPAPSGDKDRLTFAQIAYVQEASNTGASTNQVIVTIAAPKAGNCLVVLAVNSAVTISTITGGGVTWASGLYPSAGFGDSHVNVDMWYGLNSSGVGTSVTVTFTSSAGNSCVKVLEFYGIDIATGVDPTAPVGTDNGTTAAPTPVFNTTTTHDVVLACVGAGTGTSSNPPAAPWVVLTEVLSSSNRMVSAYQITTCNGAYSTSWTVGAGGNNVHIFALKAAILSSISNTNAAVYELEQRVWT